MYPVNLSDPRDFAETLFQSKREAKEEASSDNKKTTANLPPNTKTLSLDLGGSVWDSTSTATFGLNDSEGQQQTQTTLPKGDQPTATPDLSKNETPSLTTSPLTTSDQQASAHADTPVPSISNTLQEETPTPADNPFTQAQQQLGKKATPSSSIPEDKLQKYEINFEAELPKVSCSGSAPEGEKGIMTILISNNTDDTFYLDYLTGLPDTKKFVEINNQIRPDDNLSLDIPIQSWPKAAELSAIKIEGLFSSAQEDEFYRVGAKTSELQTIPLQPLAEDTIV